MLCHVCQRNGDTLGEQLFRSAASGSCQLWSPGSVQPARFSVDGRALHGMHSPSPLLPHLDPSAKSVRSLRSAPSWETPAASPLRLTYICGAKTRLVLLLARPGLGEIRATESETNMHSDRPSIEGTDLTDDQRDWSRTAPADSRVCLLTAAGSLPATIVDESFGGVGLLVQSDQDIAEGQEIGLAYAGITMRAVARWTRQLDEGQQHIGIEWLGDRRTIGNDRRSILQNSNRPIAQERRTGRGDRRAIAAALQEAASKRVARLISIGGLPVVCGLVEKRTDGTATVQLPGGVEHDVRLEDLGCSSMLERRQQLEDLDQELSILVGIYELGNLQSKDEAIDAVLEYEFAEGVA